MNINEEQIKAKYKYYRTDMLLSILKENKNISSEEVIIIEKIIREKEDHINLDVKNRKPIIYSAFKDKLILATRWHILILAASIFISFLYRSKYYAWGWIEAFVACIFVLGFGFFGTSMMFIFFTEKSKGLFYKNYIKFSLFGLAILWITHWNSCRISYTCN